MDFLFSEKLEKKATTVIFFDSNDKSTALTALDKDLIQYYKQIKKNKNFDPESKKYLQFTSLEGKMVYVFGIDKNVLEATELEKLGGRIFQTLPENENISLNIISNFKHSDNSLCHLAMGMKSKSYTFKKYKSGSKSSKIKTSFTSEHAKACKTLMPSFNAICEGVNFARDLVNEPPNVLTPSAFAKEVKKLSKLPNVSVKILDEKAMAKLGMNALLAVGQGSKQESHLAIIQYKGNKKSKTYPLALVGKGITFDTGGNSLKPPAGMVRMKVDMGGAAAVVGTMKTLALRESNANVVGILALSENMCSSNAQRPGDIVKSYSGKTIEVLNTDAEGRLVLADALWYAQEHFKPETIINLATLTGAMLVALGNLYAGVFSNNDQLANNMIASSQKTNDMIWRLPLHKEYDKLIDCDIADMKNIGPPMNAGSVLAGQFLQRFIQENVKWAHLDIAGTADVAAGNEINPKGPSGWGIRLLNQFVKDQYES